MSTKQNRRSFLTKAGVGAAALASTPLIQTFGKGLDDAKERTSMMSAPSDLRITAAKVAYTRQGGMFVKLETNQGIVGWGESVDASAGSYYLLKRMANSVINRANVLQPNVIFESIRKGGVFGGAQAGTFVATLTALECALWDLTGKALGLPIWQLLGGKHRSRVRVYCDTEFYAGGGKTPENFAKAILDVQKRGYTAVKFDLDEARDPAKYDNVNWTASIGEIERMRSCVEAARKAVGTTMDICCDMHGRYDAVSGRAAAKALEPYNLMWLEEPIPAENAEVYKTITQETSTPICCGENVYLANGFTRLISENMVDIIMPDLQKCGGLGEGQRIANLAHAYYMPFSPHMVGTMVGAMASAHVCASVPNFQILEWQTKTDTDAAWKEMVIYDKPFIEKGYMTVSDKPGIGVDVNEEGMKKYAAGGGVPYFG
jgi:galactonate dehydratase